MPPPKNENGRSHGPAVSSERETGIEPATSSLGSWHSTAELLPHGLRVRFYLRVADESSRGYERLRGLEALAHLDGVGLRGGLVRALVGGDRPLVVVALAGRVVVALAHGAI